MRFAKSKKAVTKTTFITLLISLFLLSLAAVMPLTLQAQNVTDRKLDSLIKNLKDPDKDVRSEAVWALGDLGDKAAAPSLIAALKDHHEDVRYAAVRALGNLGDKAAVPPLIAALNDPNKDVRSEVVKALGALKDKAAVPPLIAALNDPDIDVRSEVVWTLENLGDKAAVPPLIAALNDQNRDVRSGAALVLGNLRDKAALSPLIKMLNDRNEDVRYAAARALGHLGDKAAVPPLIAALNDPDKYVCCEAAEALRKLGRETAERTRLECEAMAVTGEPPPVPPPETETASAFWNAWFEDTSKKEARTLAVKNRYVVNIDLSRIAYRKPYAAAPDMRIAEELRQKEAITLILKPIAIGNLIKAPPDEPFVPKTLTLKRDRLTKDPQDEAKMKEFEEGKLSIRELSEAVNLGSIASWVVITRDTGCATLAISVWDEADISPLDHLVVTFPIVKKGEAPPERCAHGVEQKGLQAGLETLLLRGASSSSSEAQLADAALHIFESFSEGTKRSAAVFVDRDELKKSRRDPSTNPKGVYAWEITPALSDYSSGKLVEMINDAHVKMAKNVRAPYKDIPGHFGARIFSTEGDASQPKMARESLQRIVNDKTNAVILSYFIAADGSVLYLPLGLLAANTGKPVLSRGFTVMQILPKQRAVPDACFDRWTFAIPEKLDGVVSDDGPDALEEAPRTASFAWMSWLTNQSELETYLSTEAVLPVTTRGEGLILLAHHGQSDIWFSKSEQTAVIQTQSITRTFPSGSVAVLAACATSGAGLEHRSLVEKLNRLGIDAMVLSPFAVDPEFGIRLALEFQKIVVEEHNKQSNITFLELFQKATNQAIKALPKDRGYQDMALEFQVVGRTSLRFCK